MLETQVGAAPGKDGMNAGAAIAGRGVYPIGVAARLAHLAPQTARSWIRGHRYIYRGQPRRSAPVTFLAKNAAEDDIIDFEQLVTLMLVRAFHAKGLSLHTIKKAAAAAREKYASDNPFVTRAFSTDGNKVFIDLEDRTLSGKERRMIDVLSDQHQFRSIVEPSLFENVVFVDDRAGQWWPLDPKHSVLLAPDRQFGAPHIADTGVRTDVVADVVAAEGGDAQAEAVVADWFGLTPAQVADAVEFEGKWLSTPPAD
jgi:uncharacterized protein (DUF433 family)